MQIKFTIFNNDIEILNMEYYNIIIDDEMVIRNVCIDYDNDIEILIDLTNIKDLKQLDKFHDNYMCEVNLLAYLFDCEIDYFSESVLYFEYDYLKSTLEFKKHKRITNNYNKF